MQKIKDEIVKKVVKGFIGRSEVGIKKYGTTLKDNNKDNFIQHLKEELQDAILYLEKLQDMGLDRLLTEENNKKEREKQQINEIKTRIKEIKSIEELEKFKKLFPLHGFGLLDFGKELADQEKLLAISAPQTTKIQRMSPDLIVFDEVVPPSEVRELLEEQKGINVLSLFDGISTAKYVLDSLGIKVNKYYSSEINKHAIKISEKHYQDIVRLGDITQIEGYKLGRLDLLCGGSSCQGFSMAGKQEGMVTEEKIKIESLEQYLKYKNGGFKFSGESYLFWEYVRLLQETKPKYFFLENVKMSSYNKNIITDALLQVRYPNELWEIHLLPEEIVDYVNPDNGRVEKQTKQVYRCSHRKINKVEIFSVNYINSAIFSAQARKRIYWTNIPIDKLPKAINKVTKDIISEDFSANEILSEKEKSNMKEFGSSYNFGGRTVKLSEKFPTITASYGKNSGNGGKIFLRDILEEKDFKEIPKSFFDIFQGKKRIDKLKKEDDSKFNTVSTSLGHHNMYLLNKYKDLIRMLTPVEVERLMGFYDNYTEGISKTQRIKCLGNGWQVDTIKFLFKNLKY